MRFFVAAVPGQGYRAEEGDGGGAAAEVGGGEEDGMRKLLVKTREVRRTPTATSNEPTRAWL